MEGRTNYISSQPIQVVKHHRRSKSLMSTNMTKLSEPTKPQTTLSKSRVKLETSTTDTTCVKRFKYKPLHTRRGACNIRLIQVSHIDELGRPVCNIRQTDTSHQYTALSYQWGPPEVGRAIILRDPAHQYEGYCLIRRNLFKFLTRAATIDHGLSFWIDALCIDQENTKERNRQVAQMGRIYAKARNIRIWLGDDRNTANILSIIRKVRAKPLSTRDDISALFHEDCPSEYARYFKPHKTVGLLNNQYWSRTWILQEIFLAVQAVVQRRSARTTLESITHLHLDTGQSTYMQRIFTYLNGDTAHSVAKDKGQAGELLDILDRFSETESSELVDRVYGLRALIFSGKAIKVDYDKSVVEVFAHVLEVFQFGTRNVDPLLRALELDPKTLLSRVEVTDLWRIQKLLSSPRSGVSSHFQKLGKPCFPLCQESDKGPCKWSLTGQGEPCSPCEQIGERIIEASIFQQDWCDELCNLAKWGLRPALHPFRMRGHFKGWISQNWPDMLERRGCFSKRRKFMMCLRRIV